MFTISKPTAYKYLSRYEDYGLPGLLELSRAPRHVPNKTPGRIEEEIKTLREKRPWRGAAKLPVLLEDGFPNPDLLKVSTLHLILKRKGLVKERKKVEPRGYRSYRYGFWNWGFSRYFQTRQRKLNAFVKEYYANMQELKVHGIMTYHDELHV